MNKVDLVELVGLSIEDPKVVDLLSRLKIDPLSVKMKKGEFDANASNKKYKIDFVFMNDYSLLFDYQEAPWAISHDIATKIENVKNSPEGMLFLSDIILASELIFELPYKLPYKQPLLGKLKNEIYNELGQPYYEDDFMGVSCWSKNDCRFTVEFDEDDKALRMTVGFLKESDEI